MPGVLEGKILESFLKPLKGKYNGSATAEWDVVLRRGDDTLLSPEKLGALTALQNRGLRKVVLIGVGAKFSPRVA